MNNLVETNNTSLNGFQMNPSNMKEAMEFCTMLAKSDLVPKHFKEKPGDVFIVINRGLELGFSPFQALEAFSVINGKVCLNGDGALALVGSKSICEWYNDKFEIDESPAKNHKHSFTIKRKGHEELISTFSVQDAQKAGLWGKSGPWSSYPNRMLRYRALGFALRDKFPDVLKGMPIAEEVQDYEEIHTSNGISYAQEKKNNVTLTQAEHFAKMLQPKEVEDAKVIEGTFEEESTIKETEETKPFLSQMFVSPKQADNLRNLLKDDQGRLTRVLQWAGVERVEDMPLPFFNATMDKLREEQGNVEQQQEKVA